MRKITLLLLLLPLLSIAQKKNDKYRYHIKKANSPIKVDGIVDEPAWQDAQLAADFFQVLPMDTSKAKVVTEVKMTYDDQNLYVYYINYDKLPGPYMVESLKQDFNFGKNDNDLLFLDTFDDQTNGFSFGSNAAGARWDGLMFNGANVNLNWENRWVSVVKSDDDKWIWECAIPFKTLRYKKGIKEWGVNFSRLDLKTTEKSVWAPVPRQFPTASLAYTGILVWDTPPPAAGANISIIPYVLGGVSKNHAANTDAVFKKEIGFDAKVAVTSSLNLDLTVNPDFSQVEVDQQVTNLDRFELLFPERRQFFLENGDLFTNFGYNTIRPFFSRRVGLNSPIKFGARLSGKLNKDWRIGFMNMQTGKNDAGLPAQNYSVVALQRRVFARSNIAAMFVNRDMTGELLADSKQIAKFNRNIGIEYNLASPNNKWTGKAFVLKSFSPT
ncbi:MAG: carbohydrate binding family 9 domain-containing protein, partial [Spirosomaceae bacterium]|nr:carbohydrate binding family 9 domain-containing protein [Spirosomataceae bacterium]